MFKAEISCDCKCGCEAGLKWQSGGDKILSFADKWTDLEKRGWHHGWNEGTGTVTCSFCLDFCQKAETGLTGKEVAILLAGAANLGESLVGKDALAKYRKQFQQVLTDIKERDQEKADLAKRRNPPRRAFDAPDYPPPSFATIPHYDRDIYGNERVTTFAEVRENLLIKS